MAKARAIVKRRKAVRNIRKITKTMQMIATAKFQKSLKRAVGTKPYTVKVRELSASLAQNSPNPFNPTTTISFTVVDKGNVTLNVYDANGRLVRTLANGVSDVGTHELTWDGRDNAGTTVGSGVYFYRLTAGKYSESKKMVTALSIRVGLSVLLFVFLLIAWSQGLIKPQGM